MQNLASLKEFSPKKNWEWDINTNLISNGTVNDIRVANKYWLTQRISSQLNKNRYLVFSWYVIIWFAIV